MTTYYVDQSGKYLGAFGPGVAAPAGGIAVDVAPEDARQIWQDGAWVWPTDVLANAIRAERDRRLTAVLWMRDRHRDEQELGLATTLDASQYNALMAYIQALRDIPERAGFPWGGVKDEAVPWPVEPA